MYSSISVFLQSEQKRTHFYLRQKYLDLQINTCSSQYGILTANSHNLLFYLKVMGLFNHIFEILSDKARGLF